MPTLGLRPNAKLELGDPVAAPAWLGVPDGATGNQARTDRVGDGMLLLLTLLSWLGWLATRSPEEEEETDPRLRRARLRVRFGRRSQ